jgi:hypothetical protein
MIVVVADLARSDPPMSSAFVAEFARRLEGQSLALALPLTWIDQRLSEMGKTIGQMVQQEIQQEAADKVSIGNSIRSFRFLESTEGSLWGTALSRGHCTGPAGIQPDGLPSGTVITTVERIARPASHLRKVALMALSWQESLEAGNKQMIYTLGST